LGDCPGTVIDYYGTESGESGDIYHSGLAGSNIILDGRGKVRMINTDGYCDYLAFVCTNGGSLYVESGYHEAAVSFNHTVLRASGNSTITFLAGKLVENLTPSGPSFARATTNGYAVVDFTGQLFMGLISNIIDWFNISGTTTGKMWIHGNQPWEGPTSSWPITNSTTNIPVQTMNWNRHNGDTRYSDVGTASAADTRQMLAPARAEYADRSPMTRRANQTDVFIEDLRFELSQQNLWVKP
jgi:hypothetical protein